MSTFQTTAPQLYSNPRKPAEKKVQQKTTNASLLHNGKLSFKYFTCWIFYLWQFCWWRPLSGSMAVWAIQSNWHYDYRVAVICLVLVGEYWIVSANNENNFSVIFKYPSKENKIQCNWWQFMLFLFIVNQYLFWNTINHFCPAMAVCLVFMGWGLESNLFCGN